MSLPRAGRGGACWWSPAHAAACARATTSCVAAAIVFTAGAPGAAFAADDEMPPLTAMPGDAQRGRALVANRQVGLCLLCHSGPIPEERFQGNLAPDLSGAGSRWSEGQLRMRIADSKRLNPQTIMPSYLGGGALNRVGASWRGKSIFTPQQVEDVVAYLATLR